MAERARALSRRTIGRLPDLDRLIHERIRLAIVSALAVGEVPHVRGAQAAAPDVRRQSLGPHAEARGSRYVVQQERFEGRLPRTEFRLTRAGREALERYLSHLDALIRWAKEKR